MEGGPFTRLGVLGADGGVRTAAAGLLLHQHGACRVPTARSRGRPWPELHGHDTEALAAEPWCDPVGHGQVGAVIDQRVFERLVAKYMPVLWKHLQDKNLQLSLASMPWFLTQFNSSVTLQHTVRILDWFFYDGVKVRVHKQATPAHSPRPSFPRLTPRAQTIRKLGVGLRTIVIAATGPLPIGAGGAEAQRQRAHGGHRCGPGALFVATRRYCC